MTLFFALYWGTLLLAYGAFRSYQSYRRQHVLRHEYAERHREKWLRSAENFQHRLF